jgi:hypothetical protein
MKKKTITITVAVAVAVLTTVVFASNFKKGGEQLWLEPT